MARLKVTDRLIERLVGEVAPLVEEVTGWDLAIGGLRPRVLPKDMGYEEICLGRLRGAGIAIERFEPRGLLRRLIEYVIEANVLGAYEPSTEELLVVRENVDDSNLDGLRVVVSHELVHRGQHVNHPNVFERVDAMLRSLFDAIASGPMDLAELRRRIDEVRPLMTVVESHAVYVQEQLRCTHFADAVIESHFNLPTLLFRLFGGAKIRQYTDGVPQIADAVSRGGVDALYTGL